eukprot:11204888-Lingulodinium_polyedra.AAC.1
MDFQRRAKALEAFHRVEASKKIDQAIPSHERPMPRLHGPGDVVLIWRKSKGATKADGGPG